MSADLWKQAEEALGPVRWQGLQRMSALGREDLRRQASSYRLPKSLLRWLREYEPLAGAPQRRPFEPLPLEATRDGLEDCREHLEGVLACLQAPSAEAFERLAPLGVLER